jgi:UPF0755 protein
LKKSPKRKSSFFLRIVFSILFLAILSGFFLFLNTYKKIYQSNVVLDPSKPSYIFISTGSSLEDVVNTLYESNLIRERSSFEWLAEKKNYRNHVRPGRYRIQDGMSNNQLINMLRSGKQEPVRLTFHNLRTLAQLAGIAGSQLEADSLQIMKLLKDPSYLKEFGYTPQSVPALFVPDTYEFFWNTSASGFIERMKKEHDRFWNRSRQTLLEKTGLTRAEVSILASIVEEETNKKDEYPVIAGVYMNRLRRGMRLQADPTVKFANNDFSMKRVLKKHLEKDSPYNTYKYAGLPPGPIRLPSRAAIDGVLNYQTHQYLFFCAKDDFSGYHAFAKTLQEHNRNARRYQQALNKRRILR